MTTAELLEGMTDAGQFEILATRSLRELEDDCSAIAHFGVNAEGKTIANPVDGFCLIPGSAPPRYVMTAFTLSARDALDRKWLSDHTTVANPTAAKTSDDGDLIKAGRKATAIRAAHPTAKFVLYLCTNRRLDAEIMPRVYDAATPLGIEIRFLEQSRLRDFLDIKPEGQWLRQKHLGVGAEQVSNSLLQELSRASVDRYANELLLSSIDEVVPTAAAAAAAEVIQRPGALHVLVGPSGAGKSVISQGLLRRHIESDGIGVWVPAEVAKRVLSLADAVGEVLRSLHPLAGVAAGNEAIALATPDKPLLVVVDDINRSGEAERLFEKVVIWSRPAGQGDVKTAVARASVRVVCPIWDSLWLSARYSERTYSWVQAQAVGMMTRPEAVACLRAALGDQAPRFSAGELGAFAERLNDDPVLLGLFGRMVRSDASANPLLLSADVIGSLVRRAIAELALARGILQADYLTCLTRFSKELIRRRILYPPWTEVTKWFTAESQIRDLLGHLAVQGHTCRLADRDGVDCFEFRHDRILEYHLALAAAEMLKEDGDDRLAVSDPYFTPFVGRAIARCDFQEPVLDWIKEKIPISLVAAIPYLPPGPSAYADRVVADARAWLVQGEAAPASALFDALQTLTATRSHRVLEVTDGVPENVWLLEARLGNGDGLAGAKALSPRFYPAVGHDWLESLIDQARIHHGAKLVAELQSLLTVVEIDDRIRGGALCLAGYLGDSTLGNAITVASQKLSNQQEYLLHALWAGLRCSGDDPERVLGPLLPRILEVSDDETEHAGSQRGWLLQELKFATRHGVGEHALRYMADLGANNDEYRWVVVAVLNDLDHPIAIRYVVRQLAEASHKAREAGGFSPWAATWGDRWQRNSSGQSRHLSAESVAALRSLWEDQTGADWLREYAFSQWARHVSGVAELQAIPDTSPHFPAAASQRAKRGDKEITQYVLAELSQNRRWFSLAPNVWSQQFEPAVDSALNELGTDPQFHANPWSDACYELSHLLRDIPTDVAERLLEKHWTYLRREGWFIQAALYHGTEKCRALVAEAMTEAASDRTPLKHVGMFFGFMTIGLRDRLTERHLDSLRLFLHQLDDGCLGVMIDFCHRHNHWNWALDNLRPECLKRADLAQPEADGGRSYIVRIKRQWFPTDDELMADLDDIEKMDPRYQNGQIWSWWERFFERGDATCRPTHLLDRWLERAPSPARLKILAQALRDRGTRRDLAILRKYSVDIRTEELASIIANVEFAVKRRSFD
jgi:hypothetical protein